MAMMLKNVVHIADFFSSLNLSTTLAGMPRRLFNEHAHTLNPLYTIIETHM